MKAIWSRSLKSAEDTAKLIPGDSSVDLYSTDSGEGKSYDDILKRSDIKGVVIALPIVDQPKYIEKVGRHDLMKAYMYSNLILGPCSWQTCSGREADRAGCC